MTTISKPYWWNSLSNFYGLANTPGSTLDSGEVIRRLNTYLVPAPSQYSTHLFDTLGNALPTTSRIDILLLSGGHDFVWAQNGGDYISGKAGDDVLYGDAGADIFHGGTGADLIVGGNENDSSGPDTASYLDAPGGIMLTLTAGISYVSNDGYGSYDMLYGIENVIGSAYGDQIDGQDNINNTLMGGLGSDRMSGGSGNDVLVGDSGNDDLYGDAGNDILIGGTGQDILYTGTGQDRIVFDDSILGNIAANRDIVQDFQTGSGGDKLDVSALLRASGYGGSNPVADQYIRLNTINGTDLQVQFDSDGSGAAVPQTIVTLANVSLSGFSAGSNLVTQSESIIYAPILGQSNAKGLSPAGNDSESGVSRLVNGLMTLTGVDRVVSTLREPGGQPLDLAVGGSTVDGDRNTSYTADRVWWYPDQAKPGELLLRALDLMSGQITSLQAEGNVTPVIVWGQGEAETRWMGQATNSLAAMERYKAAMLAVFDYIKEHLGDDIQFYIMETARLNVEGARNFGLSESGLQQTLRGVDLIHTAQEDMALSRGDVHLATVYGDLRMLHEVDPVAYPIDYWHFDYDDREIIGDRLAGFIAADLGFSYVIRNPGPYPARVLADLTIHPSPLPPTITGTAGDDRLTGAVGGNTIEGLAGADKLIATSGNNILIGGMGKDNIVCGSGQDTIVFGSNLLVNLLANADYITKFKPGLNGDKLDISGLLSAIGYTGSDPIADGYLRLTADGTRTKIHFDADGSSGSSPKYLATLDGVAPGDFSKANNLIIRPDGGSVANSLNIDGSANPDLIVGTLGSDTIKGMGGEDTIVAGAGSDILYGGSGSDIFVFDTSVWAETFGSGGNEASASTALSDIIEDFTIGLGGDRLDIVILLEESGYTGINPVQDGYIAAQSSGSNTVVAFDRDGNGSAEAVTLATLKGVSAAAFSFSDNLITSHSTQFIA